MASVRRSFESDEEDEENHDRDVYTQLYEYMQRLMEVGAVMVPDTQSKGNDVGDIFMEINCYRMAINCDYSDIVRQLVDVIIDMLMSRFKTEEEWVCVVQRADE